MCDPRDVHARGRGRPVLRPDLHARHVRRRRRTGRRCAAVVGEHGGYYSPHHRSYGAGALDAFAEMVEVSRRSGCPLHLAHATMNFPVNAGRAGELLSLLDDAIDDGADVTLDTYPYLPGATYLSALLPSWATEGGPDADDGATVRSGHPGADPGGDLEETGSDGCHGVPVDWDYDRDQRRAQRAQRAPGRPHGRRVRARTSASGRRAVLRPAGRATTWARPA